MINSGYTRYQGRVNIDQTVSSKFKLGINSNYSYTKQLGTAPAEQRTGFFMATCFTAPGPSGRYLPAMYPPIRWKKSRVAICLMMTSSTLWVLIPLKRPKTNTGHV
ncbi:hypothetical protein KRR40_40530 [Niabella defluvii]|nr:hypothetical protein KRR40_40530 [Niabella sp. I65]